MQQTILIPKIVLQWSAWTRWGEIEKGARGGGASIPIGTSGVYQVRHADARECLTIGKASDLRMRVRQGLVKGTVPHSTGIKIRASEDTSTIVMRWAITDRPAAAEEELHRQYKARFGKFPKHTKHT